MPATNRVPCCRVFHTSSSKGVLRGLHYQLQQPQGKLVRVLEPFAPMAPGVFLYYPDRRQVLPKLRAFIDHVKSRSRAGRRTTEASGD